MSLLEWLVHGTIPVPGPVGLAVFATGELSGHIAPAERRLEEVAA